MCNCVYILFYAVFDFYIQGALAKRRTNTPGTHFPITTEVARRAANVPILNGGVNSYKQRYYVLVN